MATDFVTAVLFIFLIAVFFFIKGRKKAEDPLFFLVAKPRKTVSKKTNVAPFKSMPGPRSLPIIGTLYHYFWTKKYSFDRLHWNGQSKYKEFGPIVREEIIPGTHLVWVFRPEDIRTMYESEGLYPSRRSHTALQHFRVSRPEKYNTAGLLPTNGPQWERIRRPLQKPLITAGAAAVFLSQMDEVALDFLDLVDVNLDEVQSTDFMGLLTKVFMEMTGATALDKRLGCLKMNLPEESMPTRLIKSALDTNSNILITDNGLPVWKWFETAPYRALRKGQEYIEQVASEILEQKLKEKQNFESLDPKEMTLLERYIMSPDLDNKDIMTATSEFILAGADTSAYSSGFLFYHLATNPKVQEKLYLHVRNLLKGEGVISRAVLATADYAKAVLKESLRLNPVSVGVGRILAQDAELGGYSVPRGTVVVSQNQVVCRMEKYFDKPDHFIPERWIEGSPEYRKVDSYLVLPFGHGPRACIGKNIAENAILVLMIRFIKNYKISWEGGDLDCISLLINKPDKALHFKITRRPF